MLQIQLNLPCFDEQTGNLRKRLQPKQRRLVDIVSTAKDEMEYVWLCYRDPGHCKLLTVHISPSHSLQHLHRPLAYYQGEPASKRTTLQKSSMWVLHGGSNRASTSSKPSVEGQPSKCPPIADHDHDFVMEAARRQIEKSRNIDTQLRKKPKSPRLYSDPGSDGEFHGQDHSDVPCSVPNADSKIDWPDLGPPLSARSGSIVLSDLESNGNAAEDVEGPHRPGEDGDISDAASLNNDSQMEMLRNEVSRIKSERDQLKRELKKQKKSFEKRLAETTMDLKSAEMRLGASVKFSDTLMEQLDASKDEVQRLSQSGVNNSFSEKFVQQNKEVMALIQEIVNDKSLLHTTQTRNSRAEVELSNVSMLENELEQWKLKYSIYKCDAERQIEVVKAKLGHAMQSLHLAYATSYSSHENGLADVRNEMLRTELRKAQHVIEYERNRYKDAVGALIKARVQMQEWRESTDKKHQKLVDLVSVSQEYVETLEQRDNVAKDVLDVMDVALEKDLSD